MRISKQTGTGLLGGLAVTCLLAACAVSEPRQAPQRLPTDAEVEQYNASVPAAEHVVCRQETSVKSRIPRRVCRKVRDIAETSSFHRDQLRRALLQ